MKTSPAPYGPGYGFYMITASVKTKKKLVEKHLSKHGISASDDVDGVVSIDEPCRMMLPTDHNFSFFITFGMPICPFSDDMCVADVLGSKISRVAVIEELERLRKSAEFEQRVSAGIQQETREEIDEYVKDISRITVPISTGNI